MVHGLREGNLYVGLRTDVPGAVGRDSLGDGRGLRVHREGALCRGGVGVVRRVHEYFVAQALEVLATVAAGRGDHARAARLYGAAEALREAVGSSILPYDAGERERGLAAARGALDERGFAAAWAEGRGMTPGQMIAEAVGARSPPEK